jgi:hypothetical protein
LPTSKFVQKRFCSLAKAAKGPLIAIISLLAILSVSASDIVYKQAKPVQKASPFDHTRKEHKLDCKACHVRADNKTIPRLPYHSACIDCHVSDFTSAASQLCATCHQMPLQEKVKTSAFPAAMQEFGLKSFSHSDHMNPQKLKPEKTPQCKSCHPFDPKQVAAGFPGHPECYSCHIHQTKQKLAGCNTCHAFTGDSMKYQKISGDAYAKYHFTHASHLRQPTVGNRCDKCHMLEPNAEPVQSDITVINTARGQRHKSQCWTCHDRQTESLCRKCHVGGVPL